MVRSDADTRHERSISPPVINRKRPRNAVSAVDATPATVEAGHAMVKDHLQFYSDHFSPLIRSEHALLSIPAWQALYKRNQHTHGHHFVIHQHDHPVAGTHYDLRLQINETSSCSWAIMYGLPGNPNSYHLNRNATETRIHCLWNHLVESASYATGSLLIWDTGEYEVLSPDLADEELTDKDTSGLQESLSEPEKLAAAFARNKIRLRFHGSRLPSSYVLYIRRPRKLRHRDRPPSSKRKRKRRTSVTESEGSDNEKSARHSDAEEDEMVRRTNAYPGANNTINSIHSRTWYASMDRRLSGFQKVVHDGETKWVRRSDGNPIVDKAGLAFEPFFVKGREHERSVVTGRTAAEIMKDENVVGYVPRPGWRAVLD